MRYIRSKREYQSVYQDKRLKIISGNLFIFLIRDNHTDNSLAVGIVASRKVGKAVIRNKVKRRIKAFLREIEPAPLTGKEIVIKSKPESAEANWLEIKQELIELFTRTLNN